MSEQEFLKKLKELDPIIPKAVTYDTLYEHFEVVVEEVERLEDIEDNTIQMQAHIDNLKETINELKETLKRRDNDEPR